MNKVFKILSPAKYCSLMAVMLLLFACGGSDSATPTEAGGTTTNTPTTNTPTATVNVPPTVVAQNASISAVENQLVSLQATGADSDGSISSYAWEQTSTSNPIQLSNANSATTSFTTPQINGLNDTLTFRVLVTDNGGATASATVNVIISQRSRVHFGPIAGATVTAVLVSSSSLIETTTSLATSSTVDAGVFSLLLADVTDSEYVLVSVTGGIDIDPDDDAVVTSERLNNNGTLRALGTASDWRNGGVVNVLTELLATELMRNQTDLSSIDTVTLTNTLNQEAARFLGSDINGDGVMNYRDILVFSPYNNRSALVANYQTQLLPLAKAMESGTTPTATLVPSSQSVVNNTVPVVNAGPNQSVSIGNRVTLTAVGTDTGPLSYQWTQISGQTVTLAMSTSSTASFSTMDSIVEGTTLSFRVTVIDELLAEATDIVSVFISTFNQSPVVSVGADLTVVEGTLATINATANDADGQIVSFLWEQISGSVNLQLAGANTENVSFIANSVPVGDVTIVLRLTVTDNRGATAEDTLSILVTDNNQLPVITFNVVPVLQDNATTTISAQVVDLDGSINSIIWSQIAGSRASILSSVNSTSLRFITPDVPVAGETITFRLIARDDAGATQLADLNVPISNLNRSPIANAGPDLSVSETVMITLNGSATDPDVDSSISSIVWTQMSGPEVILSSTSTAVVSLMTPSVSVAGAVLSFRLTVTDDQGATSSDDVTVTVGDVFLPPEIFATDQNISSRLTNTVTGTLSVTIANSDSQTFQTTVEIAPTRGQLVIDSSGSFTYSIQDINAYTQGDFFTYFASLNPQVRSVTRRVNITFTDSSTPILTLSPMNDASGIAINTGITLTSNISLSSSSVTVSGSNSCSGSVQLSVNNFTDCIPLNMPTRDTLNQQFSIQPTQDLLANRSYQLRTTSAIESVLNAAATSQQQSFNTAAGRLLITEVSSSTGNSDLRWFELFNPSSTVANVSDFRLASRSINSTATISEAVFDLPTYSLQPGSYVIVRAQSADANNQYAATNTAGIIYVGSGNLRPFWSDRGYVEIVTTDTVPVTEDFVIFGPFVRTPVSDGWTGNNIDIASIVAGQSLIRAANMADTNTLADWSQVQYSTPAGPNDLDPTNVNCAADLDTDGIPDCSEVQGSTYAGLPLFEWGARTNQRDIFIEVDYMDPTAGGTQSIDEGLTPRREALQSVIDRFSAQGFSVHFDVGNLFDQAAGTDPADMDLGGGQQVAYAQAIGFTPSFTVGSAFQSFYEFKGQFFDPRRLNIFHYLLMANSQQADGSRGESGIAELNGNDLMTTLGGFGLNSTVEPNRLQLVNTQASVIMHELGHNLGLQHGGNESANYKPNYFSIMNYLYQLTGLPDLSTVGDRYYAQVFTGTAQAANCVVALSNAISSNSFVMDYSDGSSAALNENSLDESTGIGRAGGSAIDYNCDGDTTDSIALNINPTETNGAALQTLQDFNDWANLNLLFRLQSDGFNDGAQKASNSISINRLSVDGLLLENRLQDDRNATWQP